MDPILLQKQVRNNAEDLQNCMKDLKSWETEMKRKESELCSENNSRSSQSTNQPLDLPPLRNKQRRTERKTKSKEDTEHNITESDKHAKISGFDYASWDKFDADKACQQLDADTQESEEDTTESEEEDGETERLREEAMYEKEKGNTFVKNANWTNAIECYTRAIECYPFDAIFFANRALCYLKISDLEAAETDCTTALSLDISYVKAFHRRATARIGLGLLEEAKSDLEKVVMLEPKNSAAKSEILKLEKKINALQSKKKVVIKQETEIKSNSKLQLSQTPSSNIQEVQNSNDSLLLDTTNTSSSEKEKATNCPALTSEEVKPKLTSHHAENVKDKGVKIYPIYKPPHLRSKKPLKEIKIQILNEGKPKQPVDLVHFMTHPNILEVQMSDSQQEIAEEQVTRLTTKNVKPTDKQKTLPATLQEEDISNIPPPANTYVDFYVAWNIVRQSLQRRFLFLKQIRGEALPKIFGESLESAMLSELIETLERRFLPCKEPVYPYVLGISNCKRLSTLALFMNNADKERLKTLLDACEDLGECTKDEADVLRNKYEL